MFIFKLGLDLLVLMLMYEDIVWQHAKRSHDHNKTDVNFEVNVMKFLIYESESDF